MSFFSDITIRMNGEEIPGHRFILEARSDSFKSIVPNSSLGKNPITRLESVSGFDKFLSDWTHLEENLGKSLLKWIYTDIVDTHGYDGKEKDGFILNLMRTSKTFALDPLLKRCEETLLSSVNVSNCIRLPNCDTFSKQDFEL